MESTTKKIKKRLILDLLVLVRLMKRRGWTKAELARRVGWSRELLHYHIENRTVRGAETFAAVFKVDPQTLLRTEVKNKLNKRRARGDGRV